jgi:hypothetical protein
MMRNQRINAASASVLQASVCLPKPILEIRVHRLLSAQAQAANRLLRPSD